MIASLRQRINQLRLGTKLSLVLLLVLVLAIAISTAALSRVLQQQAEENVTARGELLLGMVNAVRKYTSDHVRPILADSLETETTFTAERVPAFSALSVFENLRGQPAYGDFQFKEASLDPQNRSNLADEFEAELLARFETDLNQEELSGFRTRNGERVYYIARPLTATSASCLDCHGDPAQAPDALIATYGGEHGFGWEVGQLIAAQVIYVPAETVLDDARRSLILLLGIFVFVSVMIISAINFWLIPAVIRPIERVAGVAEQMRTSTLDATTCAAQDLSGVSQRGDEVGKLAVVFQNMCRDVYAREEQLKQQLRQLRIEIDKNRQAEQVAEITETDYFQKLQAKAREIRRRQHGAEA